eukprot:c22627_g4_i1 orf=135-482(-)
MHIKPPKVLSCPFLQMRSKSSIMSSYYTKGRRYFTSSISLCEQSLSMLSAPSNPDPNCPPVASLPDHTAKSSISASPNHAHKNKRTKNARSFSQPVGVTYPHMKHFPEQHRYPSV